MSLLRLRETYNVRGDLHHACLLSGERNSTTEALFRFLSEDLSIATHGNPDLHHFEYESFGIDDGRTLQHFAAQRPLGEQKIFIASFRTITKEAQNALLKLFEDPKEHTHFFLITETTESLLPTFLSRLYVIDMGKSVPQADFAKEAKDFLKRARAERLLSLKELIESKDKEGAYAFLGALEHALYTSSKKKATRSEALSGLRELTRSKQYLFDRSSSLKLLLEHVALTLPKL